MGRPSAKPKLANKGAEVLLEKPVNEILQAEMTKHLGADSGEQTSGRREHRNSSYERQLTTRASSLNGVPPRSRWGLPTQPLPAARAIRKITGHHADADDNRRGKGAPGKGHHDRAATASGAVAPVAIALERVGVEPNLLGDPLEGLLETEALSILHHVDHIALVSSRTPISREAVLEVDLEVTIFPSPRALGPRMPSSSSPRSPFKSNLCHFRTGRCSKALSVSLTRPSASPACWRLS